MQFVVKTSRLVFALDPKRILFVRCYLCSENHLLRIPKNRLSISSKGAFINYVVSKLAIFDPLLPFLVGILLGKIGNF